jgi:hypothetical protein
MGASSSSINIVIVNSTPFKFERTVFHSYQMKEWGNSFPSVIGAESTHRVSYTFWTGGVNRADSAGDVHYQADGRQEIQIKFHVKDSDFTSAIMGQGDISISPNTYSNTTDVAVTISMPPSPAPYFFSKRASDDLIPFLVHDLIKTDSVTFKCRVKDQGSGNMKGRIYARFKDAAGRISDDTDLGVQVSHEWQNVSIDLATIATYKSFLVEAGPASISVELLCIVGAGGGHEIYIYDMSIDQRNRPRDSFFSDVCSDEKVTFWETPLLNSPRMLFKCRVKDQGSGNMKGRLYARFKDAVGRISDDTDLGVQVSHEWQNVSIDLAAVIRGYRTFCNQQGSTVELRCVVGAGLGHQIYIESIVVEQFVEL